MEEKMTPNLEVVLGSLRMKNPVTTASGTFGYGQEYDRYYDVAQLGAVTTKSISLTPRSGNKPPRLVETPAGLLNAIGLQNVGLEAYLREKAPYLRSKGATIITNIYGHSLEEYAELAARIESEGAGDAIEANLSCPNVHDARTATGAQLISQVPELVAEYTRAIRAATRLPLIIKLSPNVVDIKEPALAAEQAGADAVSLINTLIGMAIDPETRRPRLANIVGGLSGPAIRPVALKMVWEVAKVLSIPIVGMGGICTTSDAIQFLVAGATCVAIGSMSFRQPDAALQVVQGIEAYLTRHEMESVTELIGTLEI